MKKMLSLIVPAYNEEAVLAESFAQMDKAMAALSGYAYEIIYVDGLEGLDALMSGISAIHLYTGR